LGKVKGELHAVQGDVSKEEDVVRVVKWARDNLGGADVLVNNAGVLHNSPLLSKFLPLQMEL
jgi:NAD(P)-dependent dehydrogenase (short-subunit alcohol dehydrogenase family)